MCKIVIYSPHFGEFGTKTRKWENRTSFFRWESETVKKSSEYFESRAKGVTHE